MPIKSSQTLVSEALSEVKTITADEALKLSNEDKCTLIDIREKGELDKTGRIENSNHIPRGIWFEFSILPVLSNSPFSLISIKVHASSLDNFNASLAVIVLTSLNASETRVCDDLIIIIL